MKKRFFVLIGFFVAIVVCCRVHANDLEVAAGEENLEILEISEELIEGAWYSKPFQSQLGLGISKYQFAGNEFVISSLFMGSGYLTVSRGKFVVEVVEEGEAGEVQALVTLTHEEGLLEGERRLAVLNSNVIEVLPTDEVSVEPLRERDCNSVAEEILERNFLWKIPEEEVSF